LEKKKIWIINYAKNLGIEDRVIFTGPRSDVDKFYSMADIFIFPTRYEPFSNVVLEALSFECVVFTTKQNGASEILDEKFIIDKDISKKIEYYLENEEKLNKEKIKSKALAQNFSIERNVSETLKVIKRMENGY